MRSAAILTAVLAVGVAAVLLLLARTREGRGEAREPARGIAAPAPPSEAAPPRPPAEPPARPDDRLASAESGRRSAAASPPAETLDARPVPPDWTTARQFLWGWVRDPSGPLEDARVALLDGERQELAWTKTAADGSFQLPSATAIDGADLFVSHPRCAPFESGPHGLEAGEKRSVGIVRLAWRAVLEGRVVDADGRSVPDAAIAATAVPGPGGPNRHRHRARADREGVFRIEDAPAGAVRLEVSAEGFAARALSARVPPDEPVVVELERGGTLVVRVEGPRGPLEGALVRVVLAGREGGVLHARTDRRGEARIEGLAAERWTATATAEGFHPGELSGRGAEGSPRSVRLDPFACVRGRVSAASGALPDPVRVAALRADPDGRWREEGERATVTAAEDGSFELCGLAPGTWVLRATAAGHAAATSRPVTVEREGEPAPVELRLSAGGALEARVAGADGALAGARVALYRRQPSEAERLAAGRGAGGGPGAAAVATTDGRGRALFEHLDDRPAWILVSHPSHVAAILGPVAIRARAGPAVAVVALDPGAPIAGKVHAPDGSPLAGAAVSVHGIEGGGLRAAANETTAADGTYRTPPLPPGRYRVRARAALAGDAAHDASVPEARLELTLESDEEGRADLYLSE